MKKFPEVYRSVVAFDGLDIELLGPRFPRPGAMLGTLRSYRRGN